MTTISQKAETFAPGEFIRDELEARHWTQADLAQIMGRPPQSVNMIINANKRITAQTAIELVAALGTSPDLWLNMETQYRLAQAGAPDPQIARRAKKKMRQQLR